MAFWLLVRQVFFVNIGRARVKLAEFAQARWQRQVTSYAAPVCSRLPSLQNEQPSVAIHTRSLDFDDAAAHGGGAATISQGRRHHPLIKYGVSV